MDSTRQNLIESGEESKSKSESGSQNLIESGEEN